MLIATEKEKVEKVEKIKKTTKLSFNRTLQLTCPGRISAGAKALKKNVTFLVTYSRKLHLGVVLLSYIH